MMFQSSHQARIRAQPEHGRHYQSKPLHRFLDLMPLLSSLHVVFSLRDVFSLLPHFRILSPSSDSQSVRTSPNATDKMSILRTHHRIKNTNAPLRSNRLPQKGYYGVHSQAYSSPQSTSESDVTVTPSRTSRANLSTLPSFCFTIAHTNGRPCSRHSHSIRTSF